jgi:hypothetical protein
MRDMLGLCAEHCSCMFSLKKSVGLALNVSIYISGKFRGWSGGRPGVGVRVQTVPGPQDFQHQDAPPRLGYARGRSRLLVLWTVSILL